MKGFVKILVIAALLPSCVGMPDPGAFPAPSLGVLTVTPHGCAATISCTVSSTDNISRAVFLFGTDAGELDEIPATLTGNVLSSDRKSLTPGVTYCCMALVGNGRECVSTPIRQFVVDPGEPILRFADQAFKAAMVKDFDLDDDGEISESEAGAVTELDIEGADLAGPLDLTPFCNLVNCNLSANKLTEVILPVNETMCHLHLGYNLLTSLDLPRYPNLRHINLCGNDLPSLPDYHQFPGLESLYMAAGGGARMVTDPDYFTVFEDVRGLEISGGYPLDTINLSRNTKLEALWLGGAKNLTVVDLRNCPEIFILDGADCPSLHTVILHPDAVLDTSIWHLEPWTEIVRIAP